MHCPPDRFRDFRATDRLTNEEDDGDSQSVHAGTTGSQCIDRPLFPQRKGQADVQAVVSGAVEVEEDGIIFSIIYTNYQW